MNNEKKSCCNGCKKGQPRQNKVCQAKVMLEKIKAQQEKRVL